jgi:hypothetical protein
VSHVTFINKTIPQYPIVYACTVSESRQNFVLSASTRNNYPRTFRTRPDACLSYSANEAISANVKAALEKAVELRRTLETERASLADLAARLERLNAEYGRIRSNLEAAGNQSPQGQEYLRR